MKRIFTPGTPVEQVMKAVAAMMTALPAKPFAVTVEVWKKPRTNQQNAYLWGVVYPAVIEGGGEALAGWTRDDKFIAMAEAEVIKFLAEVDEKQKILEEIVSETV